MPCMHRLGAHHPFLPSMHSLRCPQPNYPPRPCMCRPGQHPACPPASPHSCGSPAPSIVLAHLRCNAPLFACRPVRHTGPLVLHLPRNYVLPRLTFNAPFVCAQACLAPWPPGSPPSSQSCGSPAPSSSPSTPPLCTRATATLAPGQASCSQSCGSR